MAMCRRENWSLPFDSMAAIKVQLRGYHSGGNEGAYLRDMTLASVEN
jgi:hypothetical protein